MTEPFLGLPLKTKRVKNLSIEQQQVLEHLVMFIHSYLSQDISYDHISLPVKKRGIPMLWNKKKVDISFVYGSKIVYVEVDTEPLSNYSLKDSM